MTYARGTTVEVAASQQEIARTLTRYKVDTYSFGQSPGQALQTAVRFMKEGDAHAVKLEGGRAVVDQVRAIVAAGVPVMAHIGFTPQSEHGLGGYRVQGKSRFAAEQLADDAFALEEAGAFAILLEAAGGPAQAALPVVFSPLGAAKTP